MLTSVFNVGTLPTAKKTLASYITPNLGPLGFQETVGYSWKWRNLQSNAGVVHRYADFAIVHILRGSSFL